MSYNTFISTLGKPCKLCHFQYHIQSLFHLQTIACCLMAMAFYNFFVCQQAQFSVEEVVALVSNKRRLCQKKSNLAWILNPKQTDNLESMVQIKFFLK